MIIYYILLNNPGIGDMHNKLKNIVYSINIHNSEGITFIFLCERDFMLCHKNRIKSLFRYFNSLYNIIYNTSIVLNMEYLYDPSLYKKIINKNNRLLANKIVCKSKKTASISTECFWGKDNKSIPKYLMENIFQYLDLHKYHVVNVDYPKTFEESYYDMINSDMLITSHSGLVPLANNISKINILVYVPKDNVVTKDLLEWYSYDHNIYYFFDINSFISQFNKLIRNNTPSELDKLYEY